MIKFTKMHGLGNDYLFINCIENPNYIEEEKISQLTRYLCNRHFGVGADGIILINKSNLADFKMDIYNADGSRAQMCGNGIRCFAKYVYDNKLTKKDKIKIETLCGIKTAYIVESQMNNNIQEIKVDMGKPIFEKEKIPVILQEEQDIDNIKLKSKENENKLVNINLKVLDKDFKIYCVSVGNPHAVIFCENIDNIDIKKYGSLIENDYHFPEKTNVEFVQVLGSSSIKMRVWERGSGETFACGTGACAVSVVSNILGFTNKHVKVYLKGGELKIDLDENTNTIYMTGIATKVFDGEIEVEENLS